MIYECTYKLHKSNKLVTTINIEINTQPLIQYSIEYKNTVFQLKSSSTFLAILKLKYYLTIVQTNWALKLPNRLTHSVRALNHVMINVLRIQISVEVL